MRKALVLFATLVLATSAFAVDLYNVATVDTGANGLAIGTRPASVAFNGADLFVGGSFAGQGITKIANPLTSPSIALQFGGPTVGNGFMSLDADGSMVVAATNNAGAADIAQTFDLNGNPIGATTGALTNGRIDGAAIDPGFVGGGGGGAGVHIGGFGTGYRKLYDPGLTTLIDGTALTWQPDLGSGTRDIAYDKTNGDMYMRYVNGVGRGTRVGDHNFARLDTGGAGMQPIVTIPDGLNSAINVGFLPQFNVGGIDVVMMNFRNATFENSIQLFDASGLNVLETANFLNADGSGAFAGLGTGGSGWYDFSYDASTGLLAVSDWTEEKIYFFAGAAIPEPTSLLLFGIAAFCLRRR
ncbi:MAG: PEP-CTERM sorting domain-containing protein [Phycisphaerae bacterium]|nr:PEP-CTERM sorting domain-containing protein [Phycisphaerae bacterium]